MCVSNCLPRVSRASCGLLSQSCGTVKLAPQCVQIQATGIGPNHSAIVRLFDIGSNGVMLPRALGLGCARLNTLMILCAPLPSPNRLRTRKTSSALDHRNKGQRNQATKNETRIRVEAEDHGILVTNDPVSQVIDVTQDQESVERQRTSLDSGAPINGHPTRSPGLRRSYFGRLAKGNTVGLQISPRGGKLWLWSC